MGTSFMGGGSGVKPPRIGPTGQNLEARAFGAPGFTGVRSAGAASKGIAAAQELTKAYKLKPTTGTAAYAPGPKKV